MGGRRAPTWTFGVALLAATALFSAGVVRDGARGPSGRMEVAAADRHTAVPPPAKRLFGGPLPGMQLDGQALEFEPDAYRRYHPRPWWITGDKLCMHPHRLAMFANVECINASCCACKHKTQTTRFPGCM